MQTSEKNMYICLQSPRTGQPFKLELDVEMYQCKSISPKRGKQRQKDHKIKARLGYTGQKKPK